MFRTFRPLLLAAIVVGCQATESWGPTQPLPSDDPGQAIQSDPIAIAWNPVDGRLIAAVYAGDRTFAILTIDPTTLSVDTVVGRSTGLFRELRLAGATNVLFYSFEKDPPAASNPRYIRRVDLAGRTSEEVATPSPVIGSFLVSPDASELLYASSVTTSVTWTLMDVGSGDEIARRELADPRSLGRDGSVVVQYPTAQVIDMTLGATRELTAIKYLGAIVDVQWSDAGMRALLVFPPFGASAGFAVNEWDEGLDRTSRIGDVIGNPSATGFCAAWSPATRSAVVMADSITTGGFFMYATHVTIAVVAGGSARTIGSINVLDDGLIDCSLSPDGRYLAYAANTRSGESSVYLLPVD